MFVGSFEGDFNQFQTDTQAAIQQFQSSGVTRLIIDLTNNGGMISFRTGTYPVMLTFDPQVDLYVSVNSCISSLQEIPLATRKSRSDVSCFRAASE